jgi:sugar lactone lactonase YvrE
MDWQALTTEPNALGESPFWHPTESRLYWVDIAGKKLCRTRLQNCTVETWQMPEEPGCIAPMLGGGLVVALRTGVFIAPVWGGALNFLVQLPYDSTQVRANDGKCDAWGRFWVGTLDETKAHHAAALYCIDCTTGQPRVERKAKDALTANGLEWSPDGRTLYWADTASHSVQAWDYDGARATLHNQRLYVRFATKAQEEALGQNRYQGRPDGAAVDAQGNYYLAMYEGASVQQFSPEGIRMATYPTPVQCPTMPCFGGDDMQTLFVTSARQGRSSAELASQPLAGCIFYRRMSVPGVPVHFFNPCASSGS